MKPKKLILLALAVFLFFYFILWLVSLFFFKWDLKFQTPVIFQKPIIITPAKQTFINPLVEVIKAEEPPKEKTWDEVAHLIIDKWSVYGKQATLDALNTFYCESKWQEWAYNKNNNGTKDYGVAQINTIHKQSRDDMWSADKNLDFAKKLYEDQGFSPWYCSK